MERVFRKTPRRLTYIYIFGLPDTRNVRGTNYCDIGFRIDERNRRLILISAIDNLVKGAAGQAVQSMNIMLGLDETTGLKGVPFPV